MSAKQLNDWMAFEAVEGDQEYRAEMRNGILCSLLANVNRGKDADAYKPEDFMISLYRKPEKKLTPAEIEAHLNKMFG